MSFALLGRKLGHSYSAPIHEMLGSAPYLLVEKEPEEVAAFLREGAWQGLNVTIPYKKTVFPLMDEWGEEARLTGCVNTILRLPDGRLRGENTDVAGFTAMVHHSGMEVAGKKAAILGSGGAAWAVRLALERLHAQSVIISRSGPEDYDHLQRQRDVQLVINCTPVGMYPHGGLAPVNLVEFPSCEGVLDLIYNPLETELLHQARQRGIPGENGLYMLVAQAQKSSELFQNRTLPLEMTDRIYETLLQSAKQAEARERMARE